VRPFGVKNGVPRVKKCRIGKESLSLIIFNFQPYKFRIDNDRIRPKYNYSSEYFNNPSPGFQHIVAAYLQYLYYGSCNIIIAQAYL
jgi:hypothetical protein